MAKVKLLTAYFQETAKEEEDKRGEMMGETKMRAMWVNATLPQDIGNSNG